MRSLTTFKGWTARPWFTSDAALSNEVGREHRPDDKRQRKFFGVKINVKF